MTTEPGPLQPSPRRRRLVPFPRRRRRRRQHFRPPRRGFAIWAAVALGATGTLLVVLAGHAVKAAVAISLLSVFFAYLMAPLARAVRRAAHRRRRSLTPIASLVVVYAACGLSFLMARALIGQRLLAQIDEFSASVPSHVTRAVRLTESLDQWQQWFGWSRVSTTTLGAVAVALSDWVRQHVASVLAEALDYRWLVPWFALVPLLSFIFLTQFGIFRRSTLRVLPRGHLRWRGREFLQQVNSVLAGYVRAQVLSALVVGSVTAAGFAVLKVPYALLVGLAAGVLEFAPLLGPIAAALLVAGLVHGGQLVAALTFLACVRLLQDAVLYPRLVGRRVHLPPLAVLCAVSVGAALGGILGVLLAVPLLGIGAVAYRQWRDYRQIERLVRAHAAESLEVKDSS